MLERFKVPESEQVRVPHERVRSATELVLRHAGMEEEGARTVADVLITNDLRGVESHGVSNGLRRYAGLFVSGELNPRPAFEFVRQTSTTATVDANWALGSHVAPWAMRLAVEKAREHGIGAVTVFHAGHISACGYHAMLAAQAGMIGHVMSSGHSRQAVPTWGAKPLLGTNAVAWAAPARTMPPYLFDIATTQVAENKIGLARRLEAKVLPGWITDHDGVPIMEEVPAPPRGDYYLLHIGGTRENGSHKGYGLGLMNEIFTNELSGLGPGPLMERDGGHFFVAYNIEAFTDLEQFLDHMDTLLREIVSIPPVEGQERVVYPGLLEAEETERRMRDGIPYHPEVIEWFNSYLAEAGAEMRLA